MHVPISLSQPTRKRIKRFGSSVPLLLSLLAEADRGCRCACSCFGIGAGRHRTVNAGPVPSRTSLGVSTPETSSVGASSSNRPLRKSFGGMR